MKQQPLTPEATVPGTSFTPRGTTQVPAKFLIAGLPDHFIRLVVTVTLVILLAFRAASTDAAPSTGTHEGPDQRFLETHLADGGTDSTTPTFPGAPVTGPPKTPTAIYLAAADSQSSASDSSRASAKANRVDENDDPRTSHDPGTRRPEARAYSVDDMLKLEHIGKFASSAGLLGLYGGPTAFSPDGRHFAYTRQRSREMSPSRRFEKLGLENSRSDVWLLTNGGREKRNLTEGVRDGSGWWAPSWSPDGRRLAMLSTRGGSVGLWVWDTTTRDLRRVTGEPPAPSDGSPYVWVDSTHLLFRTTGTISSYGPRDLPFNEISAAWNASLEGRVSASTIGDDASEDAQRFGQLIEVDLSGRTQVLVDGVPRDWRPSQDKSCVAFFSVQRGENVLAILEHGSVRYVPISAWPIIGSLEWSFHQDKVAFIAKPEQAESVNSAAGIYIYSLASGTLEKLELQGLSTEAGNYQLVWSSDDHLVFPARGQSDGKAHWWAHGLGGLTKITPDGSPVPRILIPTGGSVAFVGAANGAVFKFDLAGRAPRVLLSAGPDTQVAWPPQMGSDPVRSRVRGQDGWPREGRSYNQIVTRHVRPGAAEYFALDPDSERSVLLGKGTETSQLAAYSPIGRAAALVDREGAGEQLVMLRGKPDLGTEVDRLNAFLQGVNASRWVHYDYGSTSGAALRGWILLPFKYEEGHKYPTIVWVYPDTLLGDSPPQQQSLDDENFLNLQIAAARGYAVVFPSIPLLPYGTADRPTKDEPLRKIRDAVNPAVDKAVELGIADPHRLFILGHSFGGYGAMTLIGPESRFRAAVAIAGFSDLISLYGSFPESGRYAGDREPPMKLLLEGGQQRMGAPPWRDLERYVRNSPLFSVRDARTPLLIIHGDADFVPIAQAEEMFVALKREGKAVELVRYLGEGHVLKSPGNIKDMWERIFAWYSKFDTAGPKDASTEPEAVR